MVLQLIRRLMKYGVLRIEVLDSRWLCQLTIREPSGVFGGVVYQRGELLETTLKTLLEQTQAEYKRMLNKIGKGVQEELELR